MTAVNDALALCGGRRAQRRNGTPAFFVDSVRHDGTYDFASLASAIQVRIAADRHV